MKVHVVSDVHIDYQENSLWLFNLCHKSYQEDILIIAGDLTDRLTILEQALDNLVTKFRQVLFVPGNHELWVARDKIACSMEKFNQILSLVKKCGASTDVFTLGQLSIVPLFSWYDFTFGQPNKELRHAWADFRTCKWPDGYTEDTITREFLALNLERLTTQNKQVISFSHFLPCIEVMPSFVHPSKHYIYPVLGSNLLGEQVKQLNPNMHVYGHSHVNTHVVIDGIQYINNAYGYPTESAITRKHMICIYQD